MLNPILALGIRNEMQECASGPVKHAKSIPLDSGTGMACNLAT